MICNQPTPPSYERIVFYVSNDYERAESGSYYKFVMSRAFNDEPPRIRVSLETDPEDVDAPWIIEICTGKPDPNDPNQEWLPYGEPDEELEGDVEFPSYATKEKATEIMLDMIVNDKFDEGIVEYGVDFECFDSMEELAEMEWDQNHAIITNEDEILNVNSCYNRATLVIHHA